MNVTTTPFPHAVIDGRWDAGMLLAARDAFPPPDSPQWRRFENGHEKKLGATGLPAQWPAAVQRVLVELTSTEWCDEVAAAFNTGPLTPDVWGGGMHMIPPGGLLDVHVDFNQHRNGLYRRINCLVYLNDWSPGMGGELELRGDETVTVPPTFNTTVVFATSDHSWHGHPTPTADGFWRKSIAVYYYSPDPAPEFAHAHDTIFWKG